MRDIEKKYIYRKKYICFTSASCPPCPSGSWNLPAEPWTAVPVSPAAFCPCHPPHLLISKKKGQSWVGALGGTWGTVPAHELNGNKGKETEKIQVVTQPVQSYTVFCSMQLKKQKAAAMQSHPLNLTVRIYGPKRLRRADRNLLKSCNAPGWRCITTSHSPFWMNVTLISNWFWPRLQHVKKWLKILHFCSWETR